ncbi:RHS repeat domain-containing protein [Streptococcus azizii]|uniref:Uncharacterized protein n=1 Tax=Streptococcus azizii TaxID=1579424 RepID=A0AB36JQ57_9STRE|nr:RHS repeat domain-containing protein [Streptococcus azizii]ONK25393.1 hypothetical protein BVE86_10410 [Streptococcus azizii]ONK26445.1 hypothetical protein BVE86_07165 [Streptococcus azizii]
MACHKGRRDNFTYDDHNRLTQLETKNGTTRYTYDKNGNRISQSKNNEKLDYIYDTENRLLAVKDKAGLLFAALYDGDDNRVFILVKNQPLASLPHLAELQFYLRFRCLVRG